MKAFFYLLLISCSTVLISACKKVEGPGGSSAITGVLSAELYNTAGTKIGEYPKANEDVYIIYGEGNTIYSDKVTSSYDGSFKFDYLEKGKYSIYVYEDCETCPDGKQVKLISSEITKNKSTVDLGTIAMKKIKNTGTSKIVGNIWVMNYDGSGTFLNEGIGPDVEVYIIYGTGNMTYTDKVNTSYDGTFEFPDLGQDHYTIYAYSDCLTCASGTQAVTVEVDVTAENSTVDVGQMVINN